MKENNDIKIISSAENAQYKRWRSLAHRKYREKEKRFLIEGGLLISDGVRSGGTLENLIISSECEVTDDIRGFVNDGGNIFLLDKELFAKISETENGRGIIGEFNKPEWTLSDMVGNILVMDRLQDPGNVGTLIRTVDAAGFGGIIAVKGTVDVFSGKVVRAAAGSIIRTPIIYIPDEKTLFDITEKMKLRTVATTMDAEQEYWDEDLYGGIALIIGNEGAGISDEIRNRVDSQIKIPMHGKIESLNAAVAGSLAIYEILRQNKNQIKNKNQ